MMRGGLAVGPRGVDIILLELSGLTVRPDRAEEGVFYTRVSRGLNFLETLASFWEGDGHLCGSLVPVPVRLVRPGRVGGRGFRAGGSWAVVASPGELPSPSVWQQVRDLSRSRLCSRAWSRFPRV